MTIDFGSKEVTGDFNGHSFRSHVRVDTGLPGRFSKVGGAGREVGN